MNEEVARLVVWMGGESLVLLLSMASEVEVAAVISSVLISTFLSLQSSFSFFLSHFKMSFTLEWIFIFPKLELDISW